MPERDWPFDQPPNTASITLRSIVFAGAPILHVTHDEDDHGWQFLGMEDARENDACVVALQEIVASWDRLRPRTGRLAAGLACMAQLTPHLPGNERQTAMRTMPMATSRPKNYF